MNIKHRITRLEQQIGGPDEPTMEEIRDAEQAFVQHAWIEVMRSGAGVVNELLPPGMPELTARQQYVLGHLRSKHSVAITSDGEPASLWGLLMCPKAEDGNFEELGTDAWGRLVLSNGEDAQ